MAKFVLIMRENERAWERLPREERRRLLDLYMSWVRGLAESNVLRGGEALAEGGAMLSAPDGKVVREPYEESTNVPTGFFLIEASDLDAAVEIARGCPALLHGENVVVRAVGEHIT